MERSKYLLHHSVSKYGYCCLLGVDSYLEAGVNLLSVCKKCMHMRIFGV